MGVPIRAVLSMLNLAAIMSHLPLERLQLVKRMATYISLVQFTDKGIHAAKEKTQRVAEWAAKVQSKGVTVKQMYWTLGHYDQVCLFEATNEEPPAIVLLSADMLGNIRTQTLRAFTSVEMEEILANIP